MEGFLSGLLLLALISIPTVIIGIIKSKNSDSPCGGGCGGCPQSKNCQTNDQSNENIKPS